MEDTIKINVAVFEYLAIGAMSAMAGYQIATNVNRTDSDVMRVSEWMEVEFKKIPVHEILPIMVRNIEEEIEKIKDDALRRIDALQGKKAELLALNWVLKIRLTGSPRSPEKDASQS